MQNFDNAISYTIEGATYYFIELKELRQGLLLLELQKQSGHNNTNYGVT